MTRNDRAVTSPIEYVLTIAIATILITGLIIATTGHVRDQRARTSQAQMDVVGQQLAGSLETADRLVRMDADDDPDEFVITHELPDQVIGNSYTATISGSDIEVDSPVADHTVTVEYDTQKNVVTPVDIQGGDIEISWDGSNLVIDQ